MLKKFSAYGIFSSVPLIIFAFMYQLNMPSIYTELRNKSYARMNKVTIRGTNVAMVIYILTGIFGYLTFVKTPNVLMDKNILDAPY